MIIFRSLLAPKISSIRSSPYPLDFLAAFNSWPYNKHLLANAPASNFEVFWTAASEVYVPIKLTVVPIKNLEGNEFNDQQQASTELMNASQPRLSLARACMTIAMAAVS